eukprot:Seg5299.2 transcript_id=Seg5299.2/GoldUCD/mRNA.D3Y31 product=Rhodopsin protein_id=Seg5299.2/GoldUCD/D3Y31
MTPGAKMNLSCAFMGYAFENTNTYKVPLLIIASMLILIALPTFLINAAIILVIIRKRELHTPAYFIIANLAISDCLTGCTTCICYAIVNIQFVLGHEDPCSVAYVGTLIGYLLGLSSYNTITIQTVERYIAVFIPFWYHEKLTTRNIMIANASTWILSTIVVTIWLVTKNNEVFYGILGPVSLLCFCVTIFCYARIFREVKRIEKEMKSMQVFCSGEQRRMHSESKVARATSIILLAVVICYTPLIFLEFYLAFIGKQTTFISVALYWGWFLALTSSFINPLIACRQLSVLKRNILALLRCKAGDNRVSAASSLATSRTSQIGLNLRKQLEVAER